MNREVLVGITRALDSAFGIPIHTDSVNQKLKPPCFLIDRVQGGLKKELGSRYKSSHYFDIIYLTDEAKPSLEYLDIEESLYGCLEWINVGTGCTKALDMKGSVIDGVLHFFVNYGFHVIKVEQQEEPMCDLTIKTKLGGE